MVISRRMLLGSTAALAGTLALPPLSLAQGEPIRLATLTPLTGAGGPYGPVMVKAAKAVVDEVNAAGGVLGRKIELISEDDQTNPEAGVRAARKLIDVDKVVAIIGTWSSAVTTAVAPLCWESKTFLATVSGADAITLLPHQGYLIRTQPNTTLQGRKFGEFALAQGAKRVFFLSPQTPFFQSQLDNITAAVKKGGGEVGSLVYDDKKPSYRSEIDEALRFKPDALVLGGYTPDTTVLVKDLYRAGYKGLVVAFGYSVNQKLVDGVPAEAVEGIYTISPSPAEGSKAYERLVKLIGVANPDPYTTQVYDETNLIIMAIAAAGQASGTAIKDNIRKVAQSKGGVVVDNAVDGLKAIAAGKAVDYDGASGPCDFTDIGDIADCQFRYEQVKAGKITLVKIA
ncbi:MAG: ABC transporter substrate-binding protein [Alphaproteobacteria bacterium]|jgi:branched-chain amino acid transport system substrate-binding protein|nr:ABC transporter substrate-binding protein [Alphaproteobacteria bacterium]